MSNPSKTPIFRGQKVWLRALELGDMESYASAVNDGELAHFAGFKHPMSHLEVERLFLTFAERQGKDAYYFAICPLGSDEFIGSASLIGVDYIEGGAELRLFIADKERWGMGFGTDALNAAVDFGFGELRLERIWLFVFAYNERAIKSYKNAGFTIEGTRRGTHWHRGQLFDSLLLSILRLEWEALPRPKSWDYTS
jgi:RimJ/RimL family protein N-acetyltransferase